MRVETDREIKMFKPEITSVYCKLPDYDRIYGMRYISLSSPSSFCEELSGVTLHFDNYHELKDFTDKLVNMTEQIEHDLHGRVHYFIQQRG